MKPIIEGFRRLIIFGLGVWMIIDGLVSDVDSTGKLILGTIMVGVLSLENVAAWFRREPSTIHHPDPPPS